MKNISNEYILNKGKIRKNQNKKSSTQTKKLNKSNNQSFQQVLKKVNQSNQKKLKFSKHALNRLQSRNINLSDQDIEKISDALDKAEKKGVKDALILMNKNAFITSVKNKTVITAANGKDLEENVFTNIDGAVII